MKHTTRSSVRQALIFLLIVFTFMLCMACGSRKKSLQKSEQKTEVSVKNDTKVSVKNDVQKEATKQVTTSNNSKDTKQTFKGQIADTSKPAQVIVKPEADGTTTTTFINFKEVDQTTATNSREQSEQSTEKNSENDQSAVDLDQDSETKIDSENEEQNLNLDRGGNTMIIFWIILALAVVGYIGYHIYKKSDPLASVLDKIKGWIG